MSTSSLQSALPPALLRRLELRNRARGSPDPTTPADKSAQHAADAAALALTAAMPPSLQRQLTPKESTPTAAAAVAPSTTTTSSTTTTPTNQASSKNTPVSQSPRAAVKTAPSKCVAEVERLRRARLERRHQTELLRESGCLDEEEEFKDMIAVYRRENSESQSPPADRAAASRLRVCIRKRPLLPHEIAAGEFDVLTLHGRRTVLHETRRRVDMQRVLENHAFDVDVSFGPTDENEVIYASMAQPLLDAVFRGGRATCFAYGQTGSGKTRTMMGDASTRGLYGLAADECFQRLRQTKDFCVYVSMFEIYRESAFDLLASVEREAAEPRKLQVLEDASGAVRLVGLLERRAEGPEELLALLSGAQRARRTGANAVNERSSRSHAVMQLQLRTSAENAFHGMLTFVDLAGSERAADTLDDKRHTRSEGADINRSLLCLKECIRALDQGSSHVPFRGSKLTQVLRDSFTAAGTSYNTAMIAHVSPANRAYDYSVNTLRYAERLKAAALRRVEPVAEEAAAAPIDEPEDSNALDARVVADVVGGTSADVDAASNETLPSKVELAADALDQILDCVFDPDAWSAEKEMLKASSSSLASLRTYSKRVDELLDERIELYTKLRGKLGSWRQKLERQDT